MISINNIEKTPLKEKPLRELIKKYTKGTIEDIVVSFNDRIRSYGQYDFDRKKNRHIIKLSPIMNQYHSYTHITKDNKPVAKLDKLPDKVFICCLLSTLIHEIKHLQQKNKDIRKFHSVRFGRNKFINSYHTTEYSECETEAKEYEYKHINSAIEFYFTALKKMNNK